MNDQMKETEAGKEAVLERPKTDKKAAVLRVLPKDDMPIGMRKGKNVFIVTMLFLPILGFLVFYIGVNFQSFFLAFQKSVGYDEFNQEIVVWTVDNFKSVVDLFKGTTTLGVALRNTLIYFVAENFIMFPVSFTISYFFNRKLAGSSFFRVALYIPNIISAIVTCTAFKCVIAPNGPVSDILYKTFGYEMPNLLRQESTATTTIVLFQIFMGVQVNMLLFQGAFNRIPEEVIEAGKLDGTTAFVELTKIMIPMMWPTLSTIIILSITGIFGSSGQILLFTEGQYDTMTISYWIYQECKIYGSYNMPAAMGLVFSAINLPIVILVRWLFNRVEDVQY